MTLEMAAASAIPKRRTGPSVVGATKAASTSAPPSPTVLTRKSIRRGSFDSVRALVRHIQAYLDHWNEHPVPFVRTRSTEHIIAKADVNVTSDTRH